MKMRLLSSAAVALVAAWTVSGARGANVTNTTPAPTFATRQPTILLERRVQCPVNLTYTKISPGPGNYLMSGGGDGSALRFSAASLLVVYNDGTKAMQKSSSDFGQEFTKARMVHRGKDTLSLLTAPNDKASTLAIGFMEDSGTVGSVKYDPFNGWLNSTIEVLFPWNPRAVQCTVGRDEYTCIVVGKDRINMDPAASEQEDGFLIFTKLTDPLPGRIINETVYGEQPAGWRRLFNHDYNENALPAQCPPGLAHDGTQELLIFGWDNNGYPPAIPNECCMTLCQYSKHDIYNGVPFTTWFWCKNNPEMLGNVNGDPPRYPIASVFKLFISSPEVYPIHDETRWVIDSKVRYWLASDGVNGSYLLAYYQPDGNIYTTRTYDLADSPWSTPALVYVNKSEGYRISAFYYDNFLELYVMELQNTKKLISRTYDSNFNFWANETLIIADRASARNGTVAYATGGFGDNYAVAFVEPATGDLYVATCIPTSTPTQAPVIDSPAAPAPGASLVTSLAAVAVAVAVSGFWLWET